MNECFVMYPEGRREPQTGSEGRQVETASTPNTTVGVLAVPLVPQGARTSGTF